MIWRNPAKIADISLCSWGWERIGENAWWTRKIFKALIWMVEYSMGKIEKGLKKRRMAKKEDPEEK